MFKYFFIRLNYLFWKNRKKKGNQHLYFQNKIFNTNVYVLYHEMKNNIMEVFNV